MAAIVASPGRSGTPPAAFRRPIFLGHYGQEEDTAMATLNGMKVAILAAEGFEQAELTEPRKALQEAGAETQVVSPAKGEVQGWKHFDKGERIKVDVPLEQADAAEFDALLRGTRTHAHLLAFDQDRPRQCRRRVGRSGSLRGSRAGLQPQARGHPGIQPEDDRGICRRAALARGCRAPSITGSVSATSLTRRRFG